MGIYDRDYYRDDDSPQGFHLSGERTMATNIVIATVIIFVLDSFTERTATGRWLSDLLTLRADLFQHPWNFWQVVTYGFAHSPIGGDRFWLAHIGLNMFILWMFGRMVEEKYGSREFTIFYFVSLIFSGLVWVGIQNLAYGNFGPSGVIGASGAVTAVVILFIVNYPNQTLLFMGVMPMRAWVLGVILIGWDFLVALGADSNVAWEAHLAGAAFAFAYFRLGLRFERFVPKKLTRVGKWFASKPKIRVHDPDESDDTYQELDNEADRILEKLHQEGEESLTSKERRILEAYSRRMRQKHR